MAYNATYFLKQQQKQQQLHPKRITAASVLGKGLSSTAATSSFRTAQSAPSGGKDDSVLGGIGYVGEKIGLGFLSSAEGIWDYAAGGIAKLFGADDWAEQQFANDWVNYNHADEWYDASEGWRLAGDVGGGIGSSLPSMLGVAAGAAIAYFSGGSLSTVGAGLIAGSIAGFGAAGNATKEAYRETGELGGKEFGYGALVGATEGGLEGITSLIGAGSGRAVKAIAGKGGISFGKSLAKTTAGKVLVNAGKDFLGEAFEEGVAELVAPWYQRMTYNPEAKNATAQEIAYASFVGGLSGVLMGGATTGISTASNTISGTKAVNKGQAESILQNARWIAETESKGETGHDSFKTVKTIFDDLNASLADTGGQIKTVKQRTQLGQLKRANAAANLSLFVERSAQRIVLNADSVAERYQALGMTDNSGKKLNFTAEQILSGVDTSDLKSRAGKKRFAKTLRKALSTNSVLSTLAVADATGHIMMDTRRFAELALKGEQLADRADLNYFVEHGTKEEANALSEAFGIEDWSKITIDDFRAAMGEFAANGGVSEFLQQSQRIREATALSAESAKAMPKALNKSMADGVYRFSGENADIAVFKEGTSYHIYDYASGNISRTLQVSEVNRLLRDVAAHGADAARQAMAAEHTGLENLARNNAAPEGTAQMQNIEEQATANDATLSPALPMGDTGERMALSGVAKNGKKRYNKAKKYLHIPSEEYAVISSAIMAKNAGTKAKGESIPPFDSVNSANYFYVYENIGDDSFGVLQKIRITDQNLARIKAARAKLGGENDLRIIGNGKHNVRNALSDQTGRGLNHRNSADATRETGAVGNDRVSEEQSNGDPVRRDRAGSGIDNGGVGLTQAQRISTEIFAKENIPEYAKLSEPNKQAVRMTIRQARAYGLDADEIKVYARVAARSGLNIVFDAKSTKGGDGLFDGRNTIYINPNAPVERRHSKLLLHENGHALMQLKGGKKLIRDAAKNMDPDRAQEVENEYVEHYRAKKMSPKQYSAIVSEEIAAAYIEDVLGFEGAWDYILSEQPSIKDKWLGFFRKSAEDYAGLSDLSAQSRKFLREYKKLFDELAARNQGNNALSLAQSSQVNKTDSEKDERLSLQKNENSIANYTEKQYNSFGWAKANEVLNAGQAKDFEAKFAQALQGSKAFPKTKGGDYMIAVSDIYDPTLEGVNNVIVYARGTMEMPVISRVLKIDLYDETSLDEQRRNIYALERRGIQQTARGIFRLYASADFGHYGLEQGKRVESGRYHNQLGADRGTGGGTAQGATENRKNVKKKAVHYRFDQDGSGHGTVQYSDGTMERFALPENGKKGWTAAELFGDDPQLRAELILQKSVPTVPGRVSVSSGQMQYQIADNTREKVYTRKSALAVIGKLAGTENLTADTRDRLASALWQGLNKASDGAQRRQFAHDMAEYTVAKLVSEAKVENPDVAEAVERLDHLRTGVGKLTFSENDLAEIKHVREKKGVKQILGRWGRKNAQMAIYPMETFVNDIATSMPGMQRLSDMHPVDAFLEIDKIYGEALEASKDRWISAYWDMPDSEIPAMVASVEKSILDAFREEGEKSKFTRRVEERVKELTRRAEYWKAEHDKVRGRDRLQGVLWSQAQHLKELKMGTFLNATQHKSEVFKGSIEKLARVNWRGNLTNVASIRRTIAELRSWYVKDNPVLEYRDENSPGLYMQGVADVMDALAAGDKAFTKEELKALSQVMSFFTKIVENYNRVWRQGKWVEATPIAEGYIKILQENQALKPGLFLQMMKTSWANKYHSFYGDPVSVVSRMDLYERGFFTETFEELQRAAIDTQVAEMELLADYDAFILKNKKYIEKASSETVSYRGAEIPRMHLISLYMTLKREHAKAGLALNGFSLKAGEKKVRLGGTLQQERATPAEIDAAIKDQMTEIAGLLTKTDREYIAILEKGYNVDAKQLKAERDMQRLGFTNATEGYYYPIRRGNIAKNVDTSVVAELDRVSNASFNKSIVQGAKQELFIESADVVFRRHVHAVCQYAFLSPAIDTYNRLYNLDVSGNANHPTSVATESESVWADGNRFFKKLIADIQGIPAGPQEGAAFLAWLRGGYAKYQLGANPKVWLTQLSSLFASSSMLDADCLTRGLTVASGDVEQYCPLAKLRAYENTAAIAQGNLDGKGQRVMRKIDKFSDMLMAPIGKVDQFVIGRLFGACQAQVEKNGGGKIGTEANKKEAGKLLTRVILETQQNSIATERSEAMRSGNEFYKTLTMFSADSMKVMGRVIDSLGRVSALKARLKGATDPKVRAELEVKLKDARRSARKSIAALTLSAAFMVGVAQLFRFLYNKEKDEDESTAQIMLADFGGNLLGGLPAIRDFYSFFVDGYEMEDPSYSAINDLLSSAKTVMELPALLLSGEKTEQDAARGVKNLAYAAGQIFGLPTRNVYNVFYGLTKRFSPETAYKIDEAFYRKNYQTDLAKAIERGDGEMADYLLSLLCGERIGESMSESVHAELLELARKGYKVVPRTVSDEITVNGEKIELDADTVAAIRAEYADCREVLDRLVASDAYRGLSDEEKAVVIDRVYDLCHDAAKARVLGLEQDNTMLVGDVVGIDQLAVLYLSTKGVESDLDKDGKTISGSKRKKVVAAINSLDVSVEQRLLLICAKGYSIQNGDIRGLSAQGAKRRLLRYILSLNVDKETRQALAQMCGFEVKNGKIVAKSAFAA